MSTTDEATTRRAQDGDRRALELLWSRNRRWLAAVLLAHRTGGVELEDLLQEVAATLVERIGELRDPARLRPWLRTIALNVARGAGRKLRRRRRVERPVVPELLEVADPGAPEASAVTEAADSAARALETIRALPVEYREPLLLRCLHGHGQRRIAQLLGLPETTVETRLARGRRMLREKMGTRVNR